MLAISATILLIASGLLGIEAGIMIVLGDARTLVIKPFILLGYLEVCAIFFSIIFIAAGIVGLIFYRPYLLIAEKILRLSRPPRRPSQRQIYSLRRCGSPRLRPQPRRRRRTRLVRRIIDLLVCVSVP